MTVTVNFESCTKCGICINRFQDYCISNNQGYPQIDYTICNQCQKCIAICPKQAILMNGQVPLKISEPFKIKPEDLKELFRRRRSCKIFQNTKIPPEILFDIASVAAYAPNQNKNIEIILIDNPELISAINEDALKFVGRFYRLLFSVKLLTRLFQLFTKSLEVIKKKMEVDLQIHQRVVKENTSALFLLIGNPRVPVTTESAPHLLATMTIYAEALGIGSCLMDSLKLSINQSQSIKKRLGIPKDAKVLGVLAAGYSNEKIFNIPQGYTIKVYYNKISSIYY